MLSDDICLLYTDELWKQRKLNWQSVYLYVDWLHIFIFSLNFSFKTVMVHSGLSS